MPEDLKTVEARMIETHQQMTDEAQLLFEKVKALLVKKFSVGWWKARKKYGAKTITDIFNMQGMNQRLSMLNETHEETNPKSS